MIKYGQVHEARFDAFAIVIAFGATTRVDIVLDVAHIFRVAARVARRANLACRYLFSVDEHEHKQLARAFTILI